MSVSEIYSSTPRNGTGTVHTVGYAVMQIIGTHVNSSIRFARQPAWFVS